MLCQIYIAGLIPRPGKGIPDSNRCFRIGWPAIRGSGRTQDQVKVTLSERGGPCKRHAGYLKLSTLNAVGQ